MKLCNSDKGYTTAPMLKSAECEVASRVEREDRYVTSTEAMTRNENSDDPRLQTAEKRLELQISNSDLWAANVFHYKTCCNRFVYFYRKIPKETLCLTKKCQASLQKKNSWFR